MTDVIKITKYPLKRKVLFNEKLKSIRQFAKKNLLYVFNKQKELNISDTEMEDLIEEFG